MRDKHLKGISHCFFGKICFETCISHRIQLFFGNYLLLYIDSVRTSSGDIDT